jgi:hypothetical protein
MISGWRMRRGRQRRGWRRRGNRGLLVMGLIERVEGDGRLAVEWI